MSGSAGVATKSVRRQVSHEGRPAQSSAVNTELDEGLRSGGARPSSRPEREPLEQRLRKLLSSPIAAEMEAAVVSIATRVRSKLNINDQIRSDFSVLEPYFAEENTLCAAHREIGAEMGKADGQPVRRMLHPPRKSRAATKEPGADGGSSDNSAGEVVTSAATEPAAAMGPSRAGRKVKWHQDQPKQDDFVRRAVEEATMYLPPHGDQPHPLAPDLIRRLVKELRVTPESIAEVLASDQAVPRAR